MKNFLTLLCCLIMVLSSTTSYSSSDVLKKRKKHKKSPKLPAVKEYRKPLERYIPNKIKYPFRFNKYYETICS